MQNQSEIDKDDSNIDTILQPVSSPFFSFSSKNEEFPFPCEEQLTLYNKYTRWTNQEDQKLKEIVFSQGTKDWAKISEYFANKSARQCQYRWYKSLKNTIDQTFNKEEDDFIISYMKKEGIDKTENFNKISDILGKPVKAIKDRWLKKLSEKCKITFNAKDDFIILHFVKNFGTCWDKIIKFLPYKSESEVKSRCYTILRKYAIDESHNKNLKRQDVLIYIQKALNDLRHQLGQIEYGEILKSLPIRENKENFNSPQKKVINVCEQCKNKLKENLKQKFLARMLKKQIIHLVGDNSKVNLNINNDNNKNGQIFSCLNLDEIKETMRKGLAFMQSNNL
jgi:hypothetical protein